MTNRIRVHVHPRRAGTVIAGAVLLAGLAGTVPASAMAGGAPAAAEPWFGSMVADGSGPIAGRISCGAALVSPTRAVTAAHCVARDASHPIGPSGFSVHFGSRTLSTAPGVVRRVTRIVVSASYRLLPSPAAPTDPAASSAAGDVATLVLDRPIRSLPVLPVVRSALRTGERATFYGRGITGPGDGQSDTLKRGTVRVISDQACRADTPATIDRRSVVCGREVPPVPAQACEGDSGGPLVVRRHGREELAGVFSFGMETAGKPCGTSGMNAFADLGRVPLPH